jgi:hypothetical protein
MVPTVPNDLEAPRPGQCVVEIWRNLVIGRTGPIAAIARGLTRLLGGPFFHLFLIVRHPASAPLTHEVGRFEIYEPCSFPARSGDWRQPMCLGGFLQRRANDQDLDRENHDPVWDTHLVWARNYDVGSAVAELLVEPNIARYRWRDHYPRWYDNLRGTHVNSNTFVESVVDFAGLKNRDGTPIDLDGSGRYAHPGLSRTGDWEFAFDLDADTATLHGEWQRIHGHPPLGSFGLFGFRRHIRGRHVRLPAPVRNNLLEPPTSAGKPPSDLRIQERTDDS